MRLKINKSKTLDHVCFDIHRSVLKKAKYFAQADNQVVKLHIGNLKPVSFETPIEILVDVIRNL